MDPVPTRTLVVAIGIIALAALIAFLALPESSRPSLPVGLTGAGASAAGLNSQFSCNPAFLSRTLWESAGFPHPELIGAVESFSPSPPQPMLSYRFTQSAETGSIQLTDRCASGGDALANDAPTNLVNPDGSTQRCQFSTYHGGQSFECVMVNPSGTSTVGLDFSSGRFNVHSALSTDTKPADAALADLKEITSALSLVSSGGRV